MLMIYGVPLVCGRELTSEVLFLLNRLNRFGFCFGAAFGGRVVLSLELKTIDLGIS